MNILEQMLQDGSKHNIPSELLQALYENQAVETEGRDDRAQTTEPEPLAGGEDSDGTP